MTNSKSRIILGIESSCDDTAAAIIKDGILLSNCTNTQQIHKKYGGVVPELASRAHQQNIIPVIDTAIKEAKIAQKEITAIAFTNGPGLLGSLLVGNSFAKGLAAAWNIPLLPINHMQGHILAHFIRTHNQTTKETPQFPFICLTISGGHTQLVHVKDYRTFEVLGETIDDAAGEAFDKIAKMIGLEYPGGPLIDKLAQLGDENKYTFTHPKVTGLNYSFSGLKTAVLYFLKKKLKEDPHFIQNNKNDICASVQKTIADILFKQIEAVIKKTSISSIAIAGGVAANSAIRKRLSLLEEKYTIKTYTPHISYCTDNAAMIAMTGYLQYDTIIQHDIALQETPNARWKVNQL